jgi:hypothetical protein
MLWWICFYVEYLILPIIKYLKSIMVYLFSVEVLCYNCVILIARLKYLIVTKPEADKTKHYRQFLFYWFLIG